MPPLDRLGAPLSDIRVISCDVFDTLLLRDERSERSRIIAAERRFASLLGERGFTVSPDMLVDLRIEIQKLAFRAMNVDDRGEVRLTDIVARQLRVLGLPQDLVEARVAIEIEIEKASLSANRALADALRTQKLAGLRIVAVSDTTLPARHVAELIRHFHGDHLIDQVYSSADQGETKRRGDLFPTVARLEAVAPRLMLHIGDDALADVKAAAGQGLQTLHLPRSRLGHAVRRAHGGATEVARRLRRRLRSSARGMPPAADRHGFVRDILGPIVAQFSLLIWLYADQAGSDGDARLMFCARGGVGIREAFERVLAKLDLPLAVGRETLMVSRLVAARSAVLARSPAALEELSREFRGSSFADVARALGGGDYQLAPSWHEPFAADLLFDLLFGETGLAVLADIETQNRLFTRHFAECAAGARRIILCDTGLYGSTQRLLAAGFPDLAIETIQFARANYKGHSEAHFPRVAGLVVQQNLYNPLKPETAVLRYWHLVESLFEPAVPSVKLFHAEADGEVRANSGNLAYGAVDPAAANDLLAGALAYIDGLPPDGGATVLRDAEIAWRRLQKAITRPSHQEVACLEVGERSVDFGRSGTVRVVETGSRAGIGARLASIKAQLWREGAIVREFPMTRPALLALLETLHALRGLSARLQR